MSLLIEMFAVLGCYVV